MNPLHWAKVRVLSLPHRTDRRERIGNELFSMGVPFEFFDAIHGESAFPLFNKKNRARLANALSISRLLTAAELAGDGHTLLLEDDARFIGEPGDLLAAGEELRRIEQMEVVNTYSLGSYPRRGMFMVRGRGFVKRVGFTDSFSFRGFAGTHAVVFTPSGRRRWHYRFPDSLRLTSKRFTKAFQNPDEMYWTHEVGHAYRKCLFDQHPGISDINPIGYADWSGVIAPSFRKIVDPIFVDNNPRWREAQSKENPS